MKGMTMIQKRNVIPVFNWSKFLKDGKEEFERLFSINEASSTEKDRFEFIKAIGQGGFGHIFLVKMVSDGNFYAMKVINKRDLTNKDSVRRAINEKRILQALNFPFCIQLLSSFQDNSYLYLCLPFINGGELWTHIKNFEKLEEPASRFYGAQVLLALEYLHYCDLIYRDLKPENVLIDWKGFVKLVDFGLSKQVKTRTYSMCGTAEYLAPEICLQQSYGKAVDWWSYGVFLYEMSAGSLPFSNRNPLKLHKQIIDCEYEIPEFFSWQLADLIKNLLQVDLSKRYGNLKGGVSDIKNHSWYNRVNWLALFNGHELPPYVPTVKGDSDTSNFEEIPEIKLENWAWKTVLNDDFKEF